VAEQPCPCGFLRSVQPCPTCDGGLSPNARTRENTSDRLAASSASRTRAQGSEPHNLQGTYQCGGCGMTKPKTDFYISRTSRLGHQHKCKVCDNNKRAATLQRARGRYV
jgi:hypothetical protein